MWLDDKVVEISDMSSADRKIADTPLQNIEIN